MKQRFSSLDVKVIAHELSNALVSLRVGNIYDLSTKIFLIKFAKPNRKEQIIIDSGFRCHLTEFSRATASAPSPFVARLRKALKTRRVTSVSQIGTDRIIEFQFSEGTYRLYLEFYAGGNIILTDKDLNILSLLRIVPPGEGQEELRVGLVYSLENRQNYGGIPELTKERLQNALQKAADKEEDTQAVVKKGKKKSDALRKALAVSITEFPPMLVDHAMRITDFDSTFKASEVLQNDGLIDHLLRSLQESQRVIKEITSSEVAKGYIIAKKKENYNEASEEDFRKGVLYEDFHPFRPRQFENDPTSTFLEFNGFNKTVDEFFSSIEGQRLTSKLEERETNAKKKIESARQDQQKRLGALQGTQEMNERKASALQVNADRVQETMDAVNGLIAQGKDWVEIGKLIELEQKRGNPVATIIKLPLKLEENTVTLLLDEEVFEDNADSDYASGTDASDSEDEEPKQEEKEKVGDKRLAIDIDLALSPWANAREYFEQRRSAVEKEQKTLQSSTKALKSQEIKIAHDLKKGLKQEKAVLRPVRRQLWVEKFFWFISSDGYLVLAGKDTQQNEILYKSYLKKGDVYVHADIQGAATVVIRNNPNTPDAPIPPSTLQQAGVLAVSSSTAWDSKAGMSAWWVNADQVSKLASTGEYLPTGSFTVKGQKNFLPPASLLLGFGVMFQISEESKARHVKHRVHDDGAKPVASTPEATTQNTPKDDDSDSEEDVPNASDEDDEPEVQTNLLQTQPEESPGDAESTPPTQELDQLELEQPAQPSSQQEEDAQVTANPEESDSEPESTAPPTGTQTPSQSKKGPLPPKRGKKGKAKKLAQKYKDQDEEDRLLAQQLLGSTAGQKKAVDAEAAKKAREAELAFQKERRRAQHQRTQKETAEHEERRRKILEGELEADEEIDMAVLETLVGKPLRGDEILEAVPVCAPWAAMGQYKYKVKMQPGAVKKGKAVKEILAKWGLDMTQGSGKGWVDAECVDEEKMWPKEVECIKGFRVEEVVGVVPVGRVRVMSSGGLGGGGGGEKEKGKGANRGGRGGKGGKRR